MCESARFFGCTQLTTNKWHPNSWVIVIVILCSLPIVLGIGLQVGALISTKHIRLISSNWIENAVASSGTFIMDFSWLKKRHRVNMYFSISCVWNSGLHIFSLQIDYGSWLQGNSCSLTDGEVTQQSWVQCGNVFKRNFRIWPWSNSIIMFTYSLQLQCMSESLSTLLFLWGPIDWSMHGQSGAGMSIRPKL